MIKAVKINDVKIPHFSNLYQLMVNLKKKTKYY